MFNGLSEFWTSFLNDIYFSNSFSKQIKYPEDASFKGEEIDVRKVITIAAIKTSNLLA